MLSTAVPTPQVSKEVAKLREYEQTLLKAYQVRRGVWGARQGPCLAASGPDALGLTLDRALP